MMIMKTRILWTKIWDDSWFDSLSKDSRILFLYLITNQDIGLSGCYSITDKKICFHTHLTVEELQKAKVELSPKIKFVDNWVYVVNSQGYNHFTGKSNEVAVSRELELIPNNVKQTLFKDKPYTPNTPPTQSINHNHNHNINLNNNHNNIDFSNYELVGNTYREK